jgi:predicted RNA-binding Zn-ribbon protein involved in translation (DUF1610 family)
MKVKVFRTKDSPLEAVQYWSSAVGDLHCHGKFDITEEDLPWPLRYANTWLKYDWYAFQAYLVDTSSGFGVALIALYDYNFGDDNGLDGEGLFDSAIEDAKTLEKKLNAFVKAEVLVTEDTDPDGHELVVFLPIRQSAVDSGRLLMPKDVDDVCQVMLETVYGDATSDHAEKTSAQEDGDRWIRFCHKVHDLGEIEYSKCPACGETAPNYSQNRKLVETSYCPHCGKKLKPSVVYD